jgi:hypothetical protein
MEEQGERWPSLVQHIGSDRYSLNLVVDLRFVHCIVHGVSGSMAVMITWMDWFIMY